MGFDLGQMMDKIIAYDTVLRLHGFEKKGPGERPWSIQFIRDRADLVIEVRDSEWTCLDIEKRRSISGNTSEQLKLILETWSKEHGIPKVSIH